MSQGRKRARPDRAGEPVTGMGDKLTDSRVRQARCASTDQPFRHSNCSEPIGVRVLALRSNRRVVESGNGRCPGGTLVPFVDVPHFQFCAKKYRYQARIVQSFTCFTFSHGPCMQPINFCYGAALRKPGRHSTLFAVWHL